MKIKDIFKVESKRLLINHYILPLIILMAICCLGIGYGALNSSLEITGILGAKVQDGIFISNVDTNRDTNAKVSYSSTMLISTVTLPKVDGKYQDVTYNITVYNNSEYTTFKYLGELYGEEYYRNENIGFRVDEIEEGQIYTEKQKTFTITFYDKGITDDNNVLESHIKFEFEINPKFTITFDSNGGTSVETKEVAYGEQYGELPETTRSGYIFAGWYTSATDGERIKADTVYSTSDNITLYAHWGILKTYTSQDAASTIVVHMDTVVSYDSSKNAIKLTVTDLNVSDGISYPFDVGVHLNFSEVDIDKNKYVIVGYQLSTSFSYPECTQMYPAVAVNNFQPAGNCVGVSELVKSDNTISSSIFDFSENANFTGTMTSLRLDYYGNGISGGSGNFSGYESYPYYLYYLAFAETEEEAIAIAELMQSNNNINEIQENTFDEVSTTSIVDNELQCNTENESSNTNETTNTITNEVQYNTTENETSDTTNETSEKTVEEPTNIVTNEVQDNTENEISNTTNETIEETVKETINTVTNEIQDTTENTTNDTINTVLP